MSTDTHLEDESVRAADDLAEEPVRANVHLDQPVRASAHLGPATVTEFPVRPHTSAAVALPSLPSGPVTLVELIERRGGFDWREAVAVIQQICLYLRDHSPQAPILLDPRTIQITDKGEVLLLSGQTSSDPLVIQVGRLLRTMLMGKEAPPELRLLLAQATFELPIFESVEDVDRALAQLNKLDEPGPAGMALLRAVAAPTPPPNPDFQLGNPPPPRPILPMKRATRQRARSQGRFGLLLGGYSSHMAVIFAAIALIGVLLVTRPAMLFPAAVTAPTARPTPTEVATRGPNPAIVDHSAVSPSAPPQTDLKGPAPKTVVPTPAPGRLTTPTTERGRRVVGGTTPVDSRPSLPEPNPGRPTTTIGIVPAPPSSTSPRESERRATSFLTQGQIEAAFMEFDALLDQNPLYEPRTSDVTPEALSAFRTSQKRQLPAIAQRDYDRAGASLAAGDPDRALALAKGAIAILDKRMGDSRPDLREDLEDLIAEAKVAAAAANEIIYSETDADVVPPRALSRQMPVTSPAGVPPNRVGWLDMVIDRDGNVFFVKLTTPLNRHHERMIVSPAKAWRYRPAMKNGKPVMYRIRVKVNLPESGTE